MVAKGVPEELLGLASAKMASINTAYRDVTQSRGTRPVLASSEAT
jgi:DnaJ like chaperone protein